VILLAASGDVTGLVTAKMPFPGDATISAVVILVIAIKAIVRAMYRPIHEVFDRERRQHSTRA
jgi:hypothetical protein